MVEICPKENRKNDDFTYIVRLLLNKNNIINLSNYQFYN